MLETLATAHLAFAAAVVLGAYIVRGIAGFGSGLIAVPLLALVMPVSLVVPVVGLLDYIAATSHGVSNRRHISWRDLLPVLPFTLLGVLAALYLFQVADGDLLRKLLGAFVILYALYTFLPAGQRIGSRWWAVPAGGMGGFISALFGTGGPFYVIYFRLRQLPKAFFRATISTAFIIDGAARLLGYVASGFYDLTAMLLVAIGLPLVAAGMYVGARIDTGISQQTFSRLISVILLGAGAALLLR